MAGEILLKFLIIVTILFFIPKVLYHTRKIPYTLTEVLLGIALGVLVPSYFFADDAIGLLAVLGVITLFVSAGMEIDTKFIRKKKKMIIENMILQTFLVIAAGMLISHIIGMGLQVSLLFSLALLTPSASFIFSFIKADGMPEKARKSVESVVLSSEILGIFLLLIFLNVNNVNKIVLSGGTIIAMIALLPVILDALYKKIFSKLIGVEFTFIFVVAMISAFITELIGVHFIIGAFVAGFVAKRFLDDIKMRGFITRYKNRQISEGFVFFSLVFAPFYFFSVGLMIKPEMISVTTLSVALGLILGVTIARFLVMLKHRQKREKESYEDSFNIAAVSMPTILFTFVIAEILHNTFAIGDTAFAVLLLYGIISAALPVVIKKKLHAI